MFNCLCSSNWRLALLLLYLTFFLHASQVSRNPSFYNPPFTSPVRNAYKAIAICYYSFCWLSGSAPLTVVQLLWVNMISDILGVLALITKLPCDKVEYRASVGRNMEIFTNAIWRNIIGQSIYQLAILFVLKFCGRRFLKLSGEDAGRVLHTVIFNTFVLCQVCTM